MYVHIGNYDILNTDNIIGIFDIDTLKTSRSNLRILNMLKKRNDNSDKSVIIMNKNDEDKEEFSNISVATLKRRVNKNVESYFSE